MEWDLSPHKPLENLREIQFSHWDQFRPYQEHGTYKQLYRKAG